MEENWLFYAVWGIGFGVCVLMSARSIILLKNAWKRKIWREGWGNGYRLGREDKKFDDKRKVGK